MAFASELFQRFFRRQTAPLELSTQHALLKVSYDFHIAGNGLYTMLVTTLKDSKTSKHVSVVNKLLPLLKFQPSYIILYYVMLYYIILYYIILYYIILYYIILYYAQPLSLTEALSPETAKHFTTYFNTQISPFCSRSVFTCSVTSHKLH